MASLVAKVTTSLSRLGRSRATVAPSRPRGTGRTLSSQVIGGGEGEVADLVEERDAGVAGRAAAGHQQGSHRFDRAIRSLGDRLGTAGEDGPGGFDGVERVGLAAAAPGLAVGAVDLFEDLDPGGLQEPAQPDAVGAGALNPDPCELSEAGQPSVQVLVARWRGGERLDAQHAAVRVQRSGDMGVEVRVNPARDRARSLRWSSSSLLASQVVKGWHARPGTETVNDRSCANRPTGHPPERGVPQLTRVNSAREQRRT